MNKIQMGIVSTVAPQNKASILQQHAFPKFEEPQVFAKNQSADGP